MGTPPLPLASPLSGEADAKGGRCGAAGGECAPCWDEEPFISRPVTGLEPGPVASGPGQGPVPRHYRFRASPPSSSFPPSSDEHAPPAPVTGAPSTGTLRKEPRLRAPHGPSRHLQRCGPARGRAGLPPPAFGGWVCWHTLPLSHCRVRCLISLATLSSAPALRHREHACPRHSSLPLVFPDSRFSFLVGRRRAMDWGAEGRPFLRAGADALCKSSPPHPGSWLYSGPGGGGGGPGRACRPRLLPIFSVFPRRQPAAEKVAPSPSRKVFSLFASSPV